MHRIHKKTSVLDQSSDKDDSVPSDTNFVQNSPEHTSDHDTPTTDTIIEHSFPSFVTSQHALANYVLDNNLITLVSTQGAFIVQGRSGKYCVTLFPKESYQCPTTTCFHILADKIRNRLNKGQLFDFLQKTHAKGLTRNQVRSNLDQTTMSRS
jgi:hypothetical protein